MIRIENVKRRPESTSTGARMFGRTSRPTIASGALAARDGRLDVAARRPRRVAVRTMRLIAGAWMTATPMIEHADARAGAGDQDEQESSGGKASITSTERISSGSTQRAAVARRQADRQADGVGEQRRRERDQDHRAAAVEQAAEDVAAEEVGAEQRVARGAAERHADRRRRVVRRDVAAEAPRRSTTNDDDAGAERARERAQEAQPAGSRRLPQLRHEQHHEQVGEQVEQRRRRPRSASRPTARRVTSRFWTASTSVVPMPG